MVALPDNLADRNAPTRPGEPVVRLHPWQARWKADPGRVKVIVAHRQSGKDFGAAAEAVDDAFARGTAWYIVSLTQRQTDETFEKARRIAEAFKAVLKKRGPLGTEDRDYVEYDRQIDHWFACRAHTLHLPGGGSVTALPGRDPNTLAGFTGNVICTEFGLFPKGGYDHWRVVFPQITRGYRIIVISTPRGKNTKFYELASDPATYSVHTQTILDSCREGFKLFDNSGAETDLATFEQLYGDPAGWRREYLCEFSGDLEALIKWALLERASEVGWPIRAARIEGEGPLPPGLFRRHPKHEEAGRLEMGWDVARTGHLSALWVAGSGGALGARRPLMYLVTMHGASFALQRAVVQAAMDAHPASVGCGDATGLGMDSNETLQARYGDRWEPVTFTQKSRRDLASGLLAGFEDGETQLPDIRGPHKYLHTDLYGLQCDREGGTLKIVESANPLLADSHCDLAWAAALARRAASLEAAPFGAWALGGSR